MVPILEMALLHEKPGRFAIVCRVCHQTNRPLLPQQLGMNDSHEITSRLFANIVRVNKLTKLESNRGCRCASSSFYSA
jgi:hypothetical protein